jgi:hypothetical protein
MVVRTRADAPIVVEGAEHFIDRNYREGGRYQWVRESLVNAVEADATRVEFGTEWQGVKEHRVYRRTIADNGWGMTPEELLGFFRMYGGSGKPIGGIHENFGIGAKCSLFPWNTHGLVIVSWHPDYEEPSMIWVRRNQDTGEYGLRTFETDEGGDNVIAAGYDEDLGIDWSLVGPDWLQDQGTVLVLLGDDPEQDTVLGDPNREEGGTPGVGIVNYLNRRMWDLDGMHVSVDEYRSEDSSTWPRRASVTDKSTLKYGRRRVMGANYYIQYPPAEKKAGRLAATGSVNLGDGTEIDWYLWQGEGRDGIRNASINGYLAARYTPEEGLPSVPELFDVVDHPARFRSFGISEVEVRRRVWLVTRPPLAGPESYGVYMSSDRNRLLIKGGPKAGDPLPWDEWAVEFADKLPKPIVDAITAARAGESESDIDEPWRQRLAQRFSRRWRQVRFIVDPSGDNSTDPTQEGGGSGTGRAPRRSPRRREKTGAAGTGGHKGPSRLGSNEGGRDSARARKTAVGLPKHEWKIGDDFESGIFAIWNPPSTANPEGLVQLNLEHPVFLEEVRHWAPQYPTHLEDEVVRVIKDTYAQLAVATVAHSEALKPHLERADKLNELRSPEALTAALLGLVGPAAMIGPTLGGAVGRRRK